MIFRDIISTLVSPMFSWLMLIFRHFWHVKILFYHTLNMIKIVPITDVCLLGIWIFVPKWMSLYRKTTWLRIFVWEQYWLEKVASFDSGTRIFPGATAYLRKLNTTIFIFSTWLSESQPDKRNIRTHIFPPSDRLFILL